MHMTRAARSSRGDSSRSSRVPSARTSGRKHIMQRHSRALSGVLATVLGLALPACGGSGDRNESGGSSTAVRGVTAPRWRVAAVGRARESRWSGPPR